ncbi:MAG: trypsin-like peptidase domain-containing protein [Phycisphaeraceae bacterium]
MLKCRLGGWSRWSAVVGATALVLAATAALCADHTDTPDAPAQADALDLDELRRIEARVEQVVQQVQPAAVAIMVGGAYGSGVVVSADGYVLTVAHIAGRPGRQCTILFSDGRAVEAETLGVHHGVDAGLIKITEAGDWPHAAMGDSGGLKPGDWCVALGHPGGFDAQRGAPVRLGRVIVVTRRIVGSDATLVGGDSGGPLFDLDGNVIGIHSRIGGPITANVHVPVNLFRVNWDRLVAGEMVGTWPRRVFFKQRAAFLGIVGADHDRGCQVIRVVPDSPAAKGGLQAGDVISTFGGSVVDGMDDMVQLVWNMKPGDAVEVGVLRGDETFTFQVELSRRP